MFHRILFTLAILFAAVCLSASATTVIDPSNDVLLHLNESSGPSFKDASGHNNNGTCSGSNCPATGVRGEFGAATKFDGVNDYIRFTNPGSGNFSVEAWVNTANSSLSGSQCNEGNGLFWSDVAGVGNDWTISTLNNKLCFFTGNPDNSIQGSTNLNDGKWHHIALTRSMSGVKTLYVDGRQEIAGTTNVNQLNSNPEIHVGGNTLDGHYFKGIIDEPALYNRVFTSAEILNHYKLGALRQDVAIDPAGRFVVYSALLPGCLNLRPVYQALNANGQASGAAKPLAACNALPEDALGMDLLQDSSSPTQYFLAFGGNQATDPRLLMKIDSTGKVVHPLTSVLPASNFKFEAGASAIASTGAASLELWTIGGGGSLYRSILGKENFNLQSVKNTSLTSAAWNHLQVPQNTSLHFVALEQSPKVFLGFALKDGLLNGTNWRLSPRTDGGHWFGGLSADGLMALSDVTNPKMDQLFAQPLNSHGRPAADPNVVASYAHFSSADVSNPVEGTRYVVYTSAGQVFLKKINASTGERIGASILIH